MSPDDIDHHGQLFLSNTKIRNFTSCYKDPAFLDFFYTRLKPLQDVLKEDDNDDKLLALESEGYRSISLCSGERNFVRCQDTPIVFRELVEREETWQLTYAGSLGETFLPDQLKVDERGYLYHPSPTREARQRHRRRKSLHLEAMKGGITMANQDEVFHQYGKYSLLRSELVVSHFAKSLDLSIDGENSFEWLGQRFKIKKIEEGDAFQGVPLL